MKKRRTKNRYKVYKPNKKLYLSLSLFLGIFVIVCFILLGVYIEKTPVCTVLSAIISVFGGAFASVIVAWLIDIATCKRRNMEQSIRAHRNIDYIKMYLDELFQSFADIQPRNDTLDSADWELWFRELKKLNFFKKEPNYYERLLPVYVFLNEIKTVISEINSGELKEYFILGNADTLGRLIMLSDVCYRLEGILFNNEKGNFEHLIFCINDIITTVIPFVELSKKQYYQRKNRYEASYETVKQSNVKNAYRKYTG